MKFKITSEGFVNGKIGDKYGKRSNDIIRDIPQLSFPLEWEGAPIGTVSYAVVFQDYDNIKEDGFPWLHWSVANIPAGIKALEEDASRNMKQIGKCIVQGKNTWAVQYGVKEDICNRYGGPAPAICTHEYEVRLYAVSRFLELDEGFYLSDFFKLIRGAVLDETALYGSYCK